MSRAPVVLVANPRAGRGAGREALSRAVEALGREGTTPEVLLTEGPGHAVELARQARLAGAGLIAAVGGDGTLHEVCDGALQADGDQPPADLPLLGVIPVGSGNDYARALDVPRDPAAAARVLLHGRERRVDAGRLEGGDHGPEHFLNNVGFAFMADANLAREKVRGLPGPLSYTAAGALALLAFQARTLTVTVDGVACTGRFMVVHVGIGPYCGSGVRLTPDAAVDGGRFAVFWLDERSRLQGALDWRRVERGVQRDGAAYLTGRRVRVTGPRGLLLHADGEIRRSPLGVVDMTLLPGRVRVVAG